MGLFPEPILELWPVRQDHHPSHRHLRAHSDLFPSDRGDYIV